jgi:hypothetical protein
MKQQITLFLLFAYPFFCKVVAQMPVGQDTLYGNEWITSGQPYYKIPISQQGIYRIPTAMLPVNNVRANQFQIYRNGKSIPVYTTTQGLPASQDYLEFYGQKNKNELDSFMYKKGSISQLNPAFSVIHDTSAYFLTWTNAPNPNVYISTANPLTNLPPKETHFMYDWHNEYHDAYNKPAYWDVYLSEYGNGEGYGTGWTTNRTYAITPPALYTGQAATLTLRLMRYQSGHRTQINLDGMTLYQDNVNDNFPFRNLTFPINAPTNTMRLEIKGTFSAYDYHTLGLMTLRYARRFDFENQTFFEFTLPNATTVKYLEIENFNHGGVAPILYDVTNKIRIETTLLNGKVAIALPPSSELRNLILVNAATGIKSIEKMANTPLEDLRNANSNYIIVTHKDLLDDGRGNNYVEAYKQYRASAAGGNYKVKVVDVQQLYEQFSYGVNRHPMAIRNFANFIQKKWGTPNAPPQYLFLIGKGREPHGVGRTPVSNQEIRFNRIPTWGIPGSDNLLAGSHQSSGATIPIGRLAALTGEQVRIYLKKVMDLENTQRNAPQTIEGRGWMKDMVHLVGGGKDSPSIEPYMNSMSKEIAKSPAGMKVHSFYRLSTQPIEISQSKQIFTPINNGVTHITFFGHSASNSSDFSFDDRRAFDNFGKYPSIMALGCGSGNIHTDETISISENVVLYEDKGAIGLGAATGSAYIDPLGIFAKQYYRLLGMGRPFGLGDYIQQTNRQLETTAQANETVSVMQQFTLHGDPAIRSHQFAGPDYTPDASTVRFLPEVLTTRLDSFELQLNIANIGLYQPTDSLEILIEQKLPSGIVKTLRTTKVIAPAYSQSYAFRLPMLKDGLGKNQFFIKVDPNNLIPESALGAESNNDLYVNQVRGISVYISDNNAQIVYPQPFAIVNELPIVLKAATSNAITGTRRYWVEIDTSLFFKSPLKKRTEINSVGGLLKWQPEVNWQPNQTYYWRISPDSTDGSGYIWQNASFIYLPQSSHGWNQSHYFQFLNNNYTNLGIRPYNRQFQYVNDTREVRMENKAANGELCSAMWLDGNRAGRACWASETMNGIQPTVNVYVFDSINVAALERDYPAPNYTPPYPYGLRHGNPAWVQRFFMFNSASTDSLYGRPALIKFLNWIPDNNYVIFTTLQQTQVNTYRSDLWAADAGENLFQVLERQGAQLIRRTVRDTFPYMFIYKKGKGVLSERLAARLTDTVEEKVVFTGRWYEGKMASERIGPALNWDSLDFRHMHLQQRDTNRLAIYGIAPDGVTRQLLDSNVTIGRSLRHINANNYPYLQLQWDSRDITYRTPSQLDYWRVFYTGLPDLGLNAARYYSHPKDSVDKGEKINITIAVENTGNYNITDSISFKYTYTDAQNRATAQVVKLKPLAKGAYDTAQLIINSRPLSGRIKVNMEVNAEQRPKELLLTNNVGQTEFYVVPDLRNPLLDVTFDGQRILNNDIVSPEPTIAIALKDENRFLALSDTNLFRLYLKKPGINEPEKQMFFNLNSELQFRPAGSDLTKNNRAMVEYRPKFAKDGTYRLRIEAKDASDNSAGSSDYQIGFKVITKSSLSNVLNYPNPFSTSTQFIYTLTGLEIPESFKIQIMSVGGKIVREITHQELGDLKIGTHRTDFRWDGTDEFGDKLANGVYLYRVIAKKRNGATYETYDTGTDDLFKGGFGKLVIVR